MQEVMSAHAANPMVPLGTFLLQQLIVQVSRIEMTQMATAARVDAMYGLMSAAVAGNLPVRAESQASDAAGQASNQPRNLSDNEHEEEQVIYKIPTSVQLSAALQGAQAAKSANSTVVCPGVISTSRRAQGLEDCWIECGLWAKKNGGWCNSCSTRWRQDNI